MYTVVIAFGSLSFTKMLGIPKLKSVADFYNLNWKVLETLIM